MHLIGKGGFILQLTLLELSDYRCYRKASLVLPKGITVIAGKNAQGKTNLLESIFLCCAGRSHRGSREEEIIRIGAETAKIQASFLRGTVEHDIAMTLRRSGRKKILLDGAPVTRTADFVGQMQSVLFSPENILIVKDAPARRRAYMDVALSQVYKSYLKALMDYNKALAMRNAILRDGQGSSAWDTLSVFDVQLARCGGAVMRHRRAYCQEAGAAAAALQKRISGGADELTLSYTPNIPCKEGEEEAAILQKCEENRERDRFRRVTGAGPHRDDMALFVNGLEARLYASQGQQRTAALSIKMAELDFMRNHTGHAPILLLDDVFGELDAARREQLLVAVGDCQTILTCTNVETLPLNKSRIRALYTVDNARITENPL